MLTGRHILFQGVQGGYQDIGGYNDMAFGSRNEMESPALWMELVES